MEDSVVTKKLYDFVLEKDWEAMTEYFSKLKEECKDHTDDSDLMKYHTEKHMDDLVKNLLRPISVHKDNIISLAVHSQKEEPLKQILELVKDDMRHNFTSSTNSIGNTVLHEAAICRNFEAVKLLVSRNKELLRMKNDSGETPLFRAAAYGNTRIVKFLAETEDQIVVASNGKKQLKDIHRKKNDGVTILRVAIQGAHFGTAWLLLQLDENLAGRYVGKTGTTLYYMLDRMSSAFKSGYNMSFFTRVLYHCLPLGCAFYDESENIEIVDEDINQYSLLYRVLYKIYLSVWDYSYIIPGIPFVKQIWIAKKDHEYSLEIAKILLETDKTLKQSAKESHEEEDEERGRGIPLFAAVKTGNTEVVKYILKNYPQALELVNHMDQNILHVAALYRQKKIFNLVKEKEIPALRLARQIDKNGYTVLHCVADTMHYKGDGSEDAVYYLKHELLWFHSMKEITPDYYSMHYDNNKKTPWQLFKEKHSELRMEAKEYIRNASMWCFGTAVLLALGTIFTGPGDATDDDSLPVFTINDIVSLSCSFAAAVMFSYTFLKPVKLRYFLPWFPLTLRFCFALLFVAVASTLWSIGSTIHYIWLDPQLLTVRRTMNIVLSAGIVLVCELALVHFPLIGSFFRCLTGIFMLLAFPSYCILIKSKGHVKWVRRRLVSQLRRRVCPEENKETSRLINLFS